MSEFALKKNPQPQSDAVREAILAAPAFGTQFTDHMAHIRFTTEQGWHGHELIPYGPLTLDPAAAVLHYAQEIFEGMKAYRHADGSVWTFRPEKNAARLNRSAGRLALPQMVEEDFIESLRVLVQADSSWVPTPKDEQDEVSLYLRPFTISAERFLGLRPTQQADYYVIASPAGAYFSGGVKPVSIWLSQNLKRAGRGGTGFAKCGGNYAASTEAMIEAGQKGCQQVMFTDAVDGTHLEELGGMNLMLVTSDGRLITPEVSETILDGVTRRSLLDLAPSLGLTPEERPVTVEEWRTGVADGTIVEAFACGTAAVITPIGALVSEDFTVDHGDEPGEITMKLRKPLLDIQYGRAEAPEGWMVRLA
ncbi:branched-chain amino acid aminotransferase [Brevibacterium sp.]|uniref:branched-chain amino acid aminotransferase n=1 Tax=Brevibacterium sp. TaxID=1701 RepID=UPI0025BB9728|nr:branched-chain amino acid aminotransferase [Brevibacterium sp.]